MNILSVKNVSYYYKNKKALNNVSFEISDGVTAILGPNGAGKTTLIKLLSTINLLQEGNIKLNEIDYKKNQNNARNFLGYLPQDFKIYNNITGRDFLDFVIKIKQHSNSEVINNTDEIIEKLDMEEYIDNKIKTYSGGMKQKLGIAQAFIGNPAIIILDEPTVGLDPEQRNIIRETFPIISKENILIITTHIIEDIDFYCNNIIVLNKSKVIFSGSKKEMLNLADEKVWESILEPTEINSMALKVKIIKKEDYGDNIKIRYVCDENPIGTSNKVKPTLEDAYIYLQNRGVN